MPERAHPTIVVWVIAAVLAVLAGMRLLGGGAGAEPPPVRIDGAPAAGAPGGAARASSARDVGIYVHVAGAVRRAGLVRVPEGGRVAEAVERAGGPLRRADLTAVNLAARLQDGQQVVVPLVAAAGSTGSAAQPVRPSLATATADQLEELDGIGPTLAERIVEQRTKNGGFRSIEDLRAVDGIGEKRLEALREALRP